MNKTILYFLIAMLPVLVSASEAPSTYWQWFKLIMSALLAGLTAVKALQSSPDAPSPPPVPTLDVAQLGKFNPVAPTHE